MKEEIAPGRLQNLNPFGIDNDQPDVPFTEAEAINDLREHNGRSPSQAEINRWLHEMNEPWAHDQHYLS